MSTVQDVRAVRALQDRLAAAVAVASERGERAELSIVDMRMCMIVLDDWVHAFTGGAEDPEISF